MKKISISILALALAITTKAQINQSDETLFRKSVEVLASDEFGGRKPLTPYEKLTVDYIVDTYKQLGLQPANGDSYIQNVPLLSVKTIPKNNKIVVKGKKKTTDLVNYNDVVFWSPWSDKKINLSKAQYVFAGFGINAPEYGWNDYADIDVKGKIAIVLVNDPGFYDDNLFRGKDMTYYGRWIYKFEEASRQGALGVLVVHQTDAASYGWDVVQSSWGGVNLNLYSETENKELVALQGWISQDGVARLFDVAGVSLAESIEAAKKEGFKSFDLNATSNIELINDAQISNSANVAGIIPGTDLKDEYIVYTAHWDHLGIGNPIDGDSIYNGASDNATGVAGLFVLANRFKQQEQAPRRSILFLSVTAEEAVLLGSEYYCRHPLVPLDKTVINLNMDVYGPRGRTSDIILRAKGESETDRYVYDAAATQGRIVKPIENKRGSYFRSDHFSFAKVGVPVVLAAGGTDYLNEGEEAVVKARNNGKNTYHQPTDEYDSSWIVSGALEDIYLLYGIGHRLSNENYFPKWNDGVPYKIAREKYLK